MIQFIGHRNQIEFFVRFKADRSLKCLQYDPNMYMTLSTIDTCAFRLICFFRFIVDNGGLSTDRGLLKYY